MTSMGGPARPGTGSRWPLLTGLLALAALLSGSRPIQLLGLAALAVVVWWVLSQRRQGEDEGKPPVMGAVPRLSWLERAMPIAFPILAGLVVLAMVAYTLIRLGIW